MKELCEYAQKCNIYNSSIYRIENGTVDEDSNFQIERICQNPSQRIYETCYKYFRNIESKID